MAILKKLIGILSVIYVVMWLIAMSFDPTVLSIFSLFAPSIQYAATALFVVYLFLRFALRHEDSSKGVIDKIALVGGSICTFLTILQFI